MVKVIDQNVPGWALEWYRQALRLAQEWKDLLVAGKRVPFQQWMLKGDGLIVPDPHMGSKVTWPMFFNRRHFARAIYFFEEQLYGEGVNPPAIGPRSREWWYLDAIWSGLWYYNYFIQQTMIEFLAGNIPPWCKVPLLADATVKAALPDYPFGNWAFLDVCNWATWGEMYTYIKPKHAYGEVWIRSTFWTGPVGTPGQVRIGIYNVVDDWDQATITWNNKPAIGALLKTFTFNYQQNRFFSFKWPEAERIAIGLISPVGWLLMNSTEYDPSDARPFHYPFPHEE